MEKDAKQAVERAQIANVVNVSVENAKALFIYRAALLAVGFSEADTLVLLCNLQSSWWNNKLPNPPHPQEG